MTWPLDGYKQSGPARDHFIRAAGVPGDPEPSALTLSRDLPNRAVSRACLPWLPFCNYGTVGMRRFL